MSHTSFRFNIPMSYLKAGKLQAQEQRNLQLLILEWRHSYCGNSVSLVTYQETCQEHPTSTVSRDEIF